MTKDNANSPIESSLMPMPATWPCFTGTGEALQLGEFFRFSDDDADIVRTAHNISVGQERAVLNAIEFTRKGLEIEKPIWPVTMDGKALIEGEWYTLPFHPHSRKSDRKVVFCGFASNSLPIRQYKQMGGQKFSIRDLAAIVAYEDSKGTLYARTVWPKALLSDVSVLNIPAARDAIVQQLVEETDAHAIRNLLDDYNDVCRKRDSYVRTINASIPCYDTSSPDSAIGQLAREIYDVAMGKEVG